MCDPQWSAGRKNAYAFFAVPYSQSGIGGQDGLLHYKNVKIMTFKCDDGVEYFRAAEER